jgi:hypothetical protein
VDDRHSNEEQKMADLDNAQWSVLLHNAVTAIPTLSVLGMVSSHAAGASQALLNATQQNHHAAMLGLTAAASSAMQILGHERSRESGLSQKKIDKLLRALQAGQQNPGAPVVT